MMRILILPIQASHTETNPSIRLPKKGSSPNGSPLLLFMAFIILACIGLAKEHFIEYDIEGKPKLAEWRQEKLIK